MINNHNRAESRIVSQQPTSLTVYPRDEAARSTHHCLLLFCWSCHPRGLTRKVNIFHSFLPLSMTVLSSNDLTHDWSDLILIKWSVEVYKSTKDYQMFEQ